MSSVGTRASLEKRGAFAFFIRSPWIIVAASIAFFVIVPLGVILSFVFQDASDVWIHLSETVLSGIIMNTLWLL